MPTPRIVEFLFDDDNEAKVDGHGLSLEQVEQILDHFYVVGRNRKERRGSHMIIGRDDAGRCIAVPIEPTDDPTVWRPVTAWVCKPREEALLRRARRGVR